MAENCVLYTRSSKDRADISPAAQRTELREFAQRKGYKVAREFSDAAVSANDSPPQLAAMLRELKNAQRGWTVILAIDSSRLARDTDLAGVISYEVRKAGARIEYSKMPGGGNAAMDVLVAGVMRAIDAFHSLISKEKSLAGMRTNIELGHRAGGRAPLGYALKHDTTGAVRQGEPVRKSHLVLDPVWAPRVKRYLELRTRNVARGEAARKSGLADKPQTSLIGVERNALVYSGITVWNKHTDRKLSPEHRYRPRSEWVIQRGTHEALISEKAAEKLMERASPKTRTKRGPSGRFLLTGFLFTPSGQPMVSSGDDYYRAGKGRRIPAALLEAVVRDQMNEEVDSHEFADRFIAELRRAAEGIAADSAPLKAERKRVAAQIANLLRLAEKAPESPALAARLRELEGEQARLEEQLAHLAENVEMRSALRKVGPEQAKAMLAEWVVHDGTTIDEHRAALAQIVERIEFDPTTGEGRVLYRLPLGKGARFNMRKAARELGLAASGVWMASPRGFEPRLPP